MIANPGPMARPRRGFTLLEVLLVMVLIGLAASTVVLTLGGNGPQRQLRQQGERLAAKLQLALDEAVLRSRELGLEVLSQGYRFVLLEPHSGQWQVIEQDRLLGPVELDPSLRLELALSGFEWQPDSATQPQQGLLGAGGLFEDDSLYEASAFEQHESRPAPQVLILSSGDYTPFELALSLPAEPGLAPVRIQGDGFNPVRLGAVPREDR